MAYPTKPSIQTSYTAVEQALGDGSLPGQELDNDLSNLKLAIDALNDFVRGITRSDGRLANRLVSRESLGPDILIGFDAPVTWTSGRNFAPPQTVFESDKFYLCVIEHTSDAVFANDLTAGRWELLVDFAAVLSGSLAAQGAAEAALAEFRTRYIGAAASDPTLDPAGGALIDGALYWNTGASRLKVYDLGAGAWVFVSPTAAEQAAINTVAGISGDVSAVAAIDAAVSTVAANDADVSTVAGVSGDVSTVAGIAADVTAVAGNAADISTVAGDIADVNTVAGISGDVSTVAGIAADVTSAVGNAADISTVAGISGDVSTVAGVAAGVTTVAGIDADVTAVAGNAADISTVAGVSGDVSTVAGIAADVTAVAGNAADISTVAGDIANVNTVAGISGDVSAVAANNADVSTVAGITADVAAVAGVAADIPVVAANVADITNFADVYQGPAASDPALRNDGSALQAGDLYFNTAVDEFRVYDGAAWRSVVFGAVPQTSATGAAEIPAGDETERDAAPNAGYFRFNTNTNQFEGYNGTAWGSVGGGATGGGGDQIFIQNDQVVTTNYTIPSDQNALTTGPIDINPGVVVTVSTGARWVVI